MDTVIRFILSDVQNSTSERHPGREQSVPDFHQLDQNFDGSLEFTPCVILERLHRDLEGIEESKRNRKEDADEKDRLTFDLDRHSGRNKNIVFFVLTLDLPPSPLFQGSVDSNTSRVSNGAGPSTRQVGYLPKPIDTRGRHEGYWHTESPSMVRMQDLIVGDKCTDNILERELYPENSRLEPNDDFVSMCIVGAPPDIFKLKHQYRES
ncbi:2832_t:CDS:2 [Paraglomus occultum]|uniref:2832_t:CDS:1 n=1 Tax=Paraglomus occultum TaxID=144539 RepID=A0A9N9C6N6_9GLOM|nr:2832_t:CDS:2 [Paraglomus occultum]